MRWWNEAVANLADPVGGVPVLALISFALAGLISLGWYFWPRWLPSHWRWRRASDSTGRARRWRLGRLKWRLRWRWRRRRRTKAEPSLADLPADELPDLPAEELALTADQLAAAGRYAEAVRERLRAIVAELIERGVLPHSPGWTVTELARGAGIARPTLTPPLDIAVRVFSEIWYGLRPGLASDDEAMRAAARAVRDDLTGLAGPAGLAAEEPEAAVVSR